MTDFEPPDDGYERDDCGGIIGEWIWCEGEWVLRGLP